MRLLVAPVFALLVSPIAAPAAPAQSQPPSVQRLFEQALEAKGDEYIELRNQIAASKDAVSFLKAKRSHQEDWKPAIIAEAIQGRIEEPATYRHYEELLIVPIKAAHGFAHDWMKRKRPDPFERIGRIAPCGTANDALLTGQYWVRSGRRPKPTPQTNSQLALHQEDAVPFLVELALKEIAVQLSDLASDIPVADDAKTYSVHAAAALLNVTDETVGRWCEAGLLCPSAEDDGIVHGDLVEFVKRYRLNRPGDPVEFVKRYGLNRSGDLGLAGCYAVLRLGCFEHPAIVPALTESLRTGGSAHLRAFAAEQSSSPQAVPALRKALDDKALVVRKAAATTLGRLQDRESVPTLIGMLKDEHYKVRMAAASALGTIGDARAIEPLIEAMADENPSVHDPAGIALAKIDFDVFKDTLKHKNGTVRATAWSTIRRLKFDPSLKHLLEDYQPDVNGLVTALRDPRWIVRHYAAKDLAQKDMQILVRALKDKSEFARQEAADILGDRKYRPAVDALVTALKDESSQVRWNAVKALGQIKGPKAVDGLIAALNDPDDEVKAKVVHTLTAMGDSRAAEPLLTFMKQQSNAWLRGLACWALHGLPPESRILEAVVGLLSDEDPAVRRIAARTLGEFRQQGAVSALVRALGDEDSQVRLAAADALAQMGQEAAKPALVHSDPSIRRTALHEIAERGGSGAFDLLVAALRDPDPGIRSSAVIKLSRRKSRLIANQPALNAVIKTLEDPVPKVREITVEMLNKLFGERAFAYLADALKDDEPCVRGRAVDALKAHKGKKTVGILIEALKHEQDQGVQRVLRRTLLELTGNALTPEEWQKWWAENNPDLQQNKK